MLHLHDLLLHFGQHLCERRKLTGGAVDDVDVAVLDDELHCFRPERVIQRHLDHIGLLLGHEKMYVRTDYDSFQSSIPGYSVYLDSTTAYQ